MNPSDIFKSSLFGQSTPYMAPTKSTPLFSGSSGSFSTPRASYQSSLIPSGPQSTIPTSSTGGNSSATAPKTAYVNSQTGSTGSTGSTAPTVSTPTDNSLGTMNPNANYGGGISAPAQVNINGQTIDTTTGKPISPEQKAYTDAFNTYLQSLSPTSAETDAEKALSAQTLQAEKDQEYALNKPGQTLGFASGEAARVAHNNAFQTDALSNTVNALTGARTARTAAAQANLDFEKGLYTDSKPLPNVNVAPGDTVYNPNTGKTVFTAPTTASQNSTGAGGSAQDAATVAGWATNIKNGTAKLSDITGDPALKSAVSSALASGGSSADSILQTTSQSLQELNDMVNNNKGFTGAVGSKLAFGTLGGIIPGGLPGSSEADFNAKLKQATNDVILPNLVLLHGLGRVTDREFQALTSAVTSLNTSESEGQFKSDLADLTQMINAKLAASPSNSSSSSSASSPSSDYQSYLKAIGAQ